MRSGHRLILALGGLALAGCHPAPVAPDSGTPSGADAGRIAVTVRDAGPPPLPKLVITAQVFPAPDAETPDGVTLDGGTAPVVLAPDQTPLVPPTRRLILRTNQPLHDARLRIFDEADRIVPSDEQLDASDAGLTDEVSFLAPLIPGHHYTVVLDAQTGATALDSRGQPVPDQRLGFAILGERPPAHPVRRDRHRGSTRKRRHHSR